MRKLAIFEHISLDGVIRVRASSFLCSGSEPIPRGHAERSSASDNRLLEFYAKVPGERTQRVWFAQLALDHGPA